jgi:cytochrome b561
MVTAGLSATLLAGALVMASGADRAAPVQAKAAAAATAPVWTVDPAGSRLGFATRWAGQAVNGQFRQWSADIRFDPARLAQSKAVVIVQTGSAQTGMREPDDNLPGEDFFAVRRFPTARYETTAIRALGGNRYEADGLLTIKGVAYRLRLPFTLDIAGNVATMNGRSTLDRMTVRMGVESDSSAEWVAREVTINVAVRATRR